eukprot:7004021-Prymnesium_polylepis.1
MTAANLPRARARETHTHPRSADRAHVSHRCARVAFHALRLSPLVLPRCANRGRRSAAFMTLRWPTPTTLTRSRRALARHGERRPALRPGALRPVHALRTMAVRPLTVRPLAVRTMVVRPLAVRPLVVRPLAVRPLAVRPLAVRPLVVRPLVVRTVQHSGRVQHSEGCSNRTLALERTCERRAIAAGHACSTAAATAAMLCPAAQQGRLGEATESFESASRMSPKNAKLVRRPEDRTQGKPQETCRCALHAAGARQQL